jgi:hypothetical protein
MVVLTPSFRQQLRNHFRFILPEQGSFVIIIVPRPHFTRVTQA